MMSSSARFRRLMTIALAVMVIATGVPWAQVHAHENAGEIQGAPLSHQDQLHDGNSQDSGLHVHDLGLFGESPMTLAPALRLPAPETTDDQFFEPYLLPPQAEHAPLLRPPART